jgi:hypothetical protein
MTTPLRCDMHPYRGKWAAIATMHRKDHAIAGALGYAFNMTITTAPGINTDDLGTFTGEVERKGTMIDAARTKALLAIKHTGAPLGIGSEGSFGPDPHLPFLASGLEVLLLREAATGHEVIVSRRTPTNYDHAIVGPADDLTPFLARVGFPAHAVVVQPEPRGSRPIAKGLTSSQALAAALDRAWAATGKAMITTDMRAHLNPTRMAAIGRTSKWLALRTARRCPACGKAGFGVVDVERGLRCRDCGEPTRLIRAEIHGCTACGTRLKRRERSPTLNADPTWCPVCNP